ncbi:MAG TPA: DUF3606 domain-containing protein [Devosia sp.]|nr:DUF3606 domain-containing protein [Devosia sp.]
MPDTKSHLGEPDHTLTTGGERYEIQHLAERFGISTNEARELIETFGNDRETLEREAMKLRQR